MKWLRRKLVEWLREEEAEGPRREFVYLDEVSVYSLLASRLGAVPTELTDTESETFRSSVGGSLGASTPIGGAGLRSQLEGSRTRGTQVVRKAIVQATFKDLVDREAERMRVHDSATAAPVPEAESLDDLRALQGKGESNHLIATSELVRGDLLELEVALDSDSVYQASLMTATMLGFFERAPDFFPMDQAGLAQVRAVNTVFEELLAGLVPIQARATRYERVVIDGEEFLASKPLLGQLDPGIDLRREPIYLVGVTEAELYWRDLRRVLFSDSRFFVMLRLSRGGLRTSWTPIKVVDLLERAIPGAGEMINGIGPEFLAGVTRGASETADGKAGGSDRDLLNEYANAVAAEAGTKWSDEDNDAVDLAALQPDFSSVENQRKTVAPIAEQIEKRTGTELDRAHVADLRENLMSKHGYREGSTPKKEAGERGRDSASDPRHLLDSEIVAIYW